MSLLSVDDLTVRFGSTVGVSVGRSRSRPARSPASSAPTGPARRRPCSASTPAAPAPVGGRVPPSTGKDVTSLSTAQLVRRGHRPVSREPTSVPQHVDRRQPAARRGQRQQPGGSAGAAGGVLRALPVDRRTPQRARRPAQRWAATDRRHCPCADVEPQGRPPRRAVERPGAGGDRGDPRPATSTLPATGTGVLPPSNRTSSSCSRCASGRGSSPTAPSRTPAPSPNCSKGCALPMPTSAGSTSSKTMSPSTERSRSAPLRGGTDMTASTYTGRSPARQNRDRRPVVARSGSFTDLRGAARPRLRGARPALRPGGGGARRAGAVVYGLDHAATARVAASGCSSRTTRRSSTTPRPGARTRSDWPRPSRGLHRPFDGRDDRRPLRPAYGAGLAAVVLPGPVSACAPCRRTSSP